MRENLDFESLSENSKESLHYDIFQRPTSSTPVVSTLTARIEVQLASFRVIERTTIDTDIFEWWNRQGGQFPDLLRLARIVHSIPATSISSERLFSKAGFSASMADKILVIKANLNKILLAPSAEEDDFSFIETDDFNDE
uniref:Dimer_Tnp_hAT domain-containing protein n=1 Tax=Meloidogyne hapla TaxID=6305 RepID=A0A1I8BY15_MELHA